MVSANLRKGNCELRSSAKAGGAGEKLGAVDLANFVAGILPAYRLATHVCRGRKDSLTAALASSTAYLQQAALVGAHELDGRAVLALGEV